MGHCDPEWMSGEPSTSDTNITRRQRERPNRIYRLPLDMPVFMDGPSCRSARFSSCPARCRVGGKHEGPATLKRRGLRMSRAVRRDYYGQMRPMTVTFAPVRATLLLSLA
jgi:hypothetical protein